MLGVPWSFPVVFPVVFPVPSMFCAAYVTEGSRRERQGWPEWAVSGKISFCVAHLRDTPSR